MTDRARFEELAAEALDGLPAWVRDRMDNVDVFVEDHAPPDQPTLLGLYHGIPLNRRGYGYSGAMPDRITLFRDTIEAQARDEDALRALVARTIAHEVAHHFGITDDRLREIGRY